MHRSEKSGARGAASSPRRFSRRGVVAVLALLAGGMISAAWAAPAEVTSLPAKKSYDLVIDQGGFNAAGKPMKSMQINGGIPGPILRFKEGDDVEIRVTNRLKEDSSLHWHGLLVPANMDGVPHLSFPGIKPGETFTYRFKLQQAGTYWYHSHSGMQEPLGVYGALIIDPAQPEPYTYDRDYVVLLSDWFDEDPHAALANLKKVEGYYNHHKRTLADLVRDVRQAGDARAKREAIQEQLAWDQMRMDRTDISDVGENMRLLMNGETADQNWTALFKPGEKVRLRFINASSMTFFDVRIPGLKMRVVQADGQDVQPVTVDEIRLGTAETYDVIVEPAAARAYTIFAQDLASTSLVRGTLAPRAGLSAAIPALKPRPVRTMADMGHGHAGHGGSGREMDHPAPAGVDHSKHTPEEHARLTAGVDHRRHSPEEHAAHLAHAGHGAAAPGNDVAGALRLLEYRDLRAVTPNEDRRAPEREEIVRLTGDMHRYFWTINDKKFSEAEPIRLKLDERVRFKIVNETMMEHPMHLHGVFMETVSGKGAYEPRKHTIIVKPGETVLVDFTFTEPGEWAFHCHLMFHMDTGMARKVIVE